MPRRQWRSGSPGRENQTDAEHGCDCRHTPILGDVMREHGDAEWQRQETDQGQWNHDLGGAAGTYL